MEEVRLVARSVVADAEAQHFYNHHAVLTAKAVLYKLPSVKNLLCFDTLSISGLLANSIIDTCALQYKGSKIE